MMVITRKKPTGSMIKEHLEQWGIKQIWLATQTGISKEHISNILADRVLLTQDNLNKINDTLGTDFRLIA